MAIAAAVLLSTSASTVRAESEEIPVESEEIPVESEEIPVESEEIPVESEMAYAEGAIAYAEGDCERATPLLRRSLELAPEQLRAAHILGLCLLAGEDYEGAIDVLEPAAAAHGDDLPLQLDLGVAYLLWGNTAFASRTLGAVVERQPDSARARFYLGAALSQQGDCDEAARELTEARRLDEALAPRARYLAGVCRVREGDFEAARNELEPLARSPLDEPVADAARRFVQMALRTEGIETARLSLGAATSLQFDSNPTLAPNSGEHLHSVAPVLQGDLTLRAVASERQTLAGRVAFYRSFYFPDERAADYNYTHVAASAFYQLRGEAGGVRHQLQLGYDFALGLFDGERPLTDQNHLFSELHGARVLWSARETENLLSRVSLLVQHHSYALRRRDNLGVTVGFGQAIAIPTAGLQLYLEGTVRLEDAHDRDYDVIAPGALVSLSARLPWELALSAVALYEHEAHPSSSEARVDEQLTFTLSLRRPIIRHLALSLAWVHTENISTVLRFDYRRDIASLSLLGSL